MNIFKRVLTLALPLAFTVFAGAGTIAQADPAVTLPMAPTAAKSGDGGYTAASASLPGDNGSPLEPYLYLCILAGGGILAAVGVAITDRRVRAAR
jgi:hypothetical protein